MTLEKLIKYLPLGGALLVFLGVLKQAIYFDYFGVSITHYIDTSSALTLFLDDYRTFIVLFVMGFIHLNLSENFIEKIDSKIGNNFFEQIIARFRRGYLIFFLLTTSSMIALISYNQVPLNDFVIYSTTFLAFNFITFLFMKTGKDQNGEWEIVGMRMERVYELISFLVVIAIVPMLSFKEIRETESNDKDMVLYLDDKSVLDTRDNLINLGKVGGYVFLKDEVTGENIIINFDKVVKTKKVN